MKQKTFMMLKPDAFESGHVREVLDELRAHGLEIEKSCTITVTMEVMKTLIDHYAGVIDSMSKDFNFPGKLFNSFYYDGPHSIMPMEVSYEGGRYHHPDKDACRKDESTGSRRRYTSRKIQQ